MDSPDLDQMYETFIRIGTVTTWQQPIFEGIKTKLAPTIEQLKREWNIKWYSFLIHTRQSGVPTVETDNNGYFHIRFSMPKDVDEENLLRSLPDYCLMTRKIEPPLKTITFSGGGYNPSLHNKEGIEAVWQIIGEQSELILKIFDSYKKNINIPPQEIGSLLHYFHNMVGAFVIQCPKCESLIQI